MQLINVNVLPETNVDWIANGELGNETVLNRPIKAVATHVNTLINEVTVLTALMGNGFHVPLNDLGAGAVNTAIKDGVGVATFTRAGATATTIGSTGLVLKGIGANVARSYYDPTTLAYMGYLSEGARTNLCLQSEDFSSVSWSKTTGVTVTANYAVSPDGQTTADRIQYDGTGAAGDYRFYTSGGAYGVSEAVSFSIWLRSNSPATLRMGGNTGTVASLGVTSAWTRFTFTATGSGPADRQLLIYSNDSNNAAFDIQAWGGQIESGAFASTYIPTTTAAVTRNADILNFPSSGNAAAPALTMFAEASFNSSLTNACVVTVSAASYSTGNGALLKAATSSNVQAGGNGSAASAITSYSSGINKYAGSFNTSGTRQAACGKGGTVATNTTLDWSGVGTTLVNLGSLDPAGSQHFYGTLKNVRIWQTQLPDATLQLLTA